MCGADCFGESSGGTFNLGRRFGPQSVLASPTASIPRGRGRRWLSPAAAAAAEVAAEELETEEVLEVTRSEAAVAAAWKGVTAHGSATGRLSRGCRLHAQLPNLEGMVPLKLKLC
ncbi:hypothetical protein ABZP36_009538 [Zizania latifolia]